MSPDLPLVSRRVLSSFSNSKEQNAEMRNEKMRKCRNKGKQSSKTVSHKTKSRMLISSSRAVDNTMSHVLELFCTPTRWRCHPNQVEEVNC